MDKLSKKNLAEEVKKNWVKNFYYNRNNIQKLIFLFSFLNNENFISILSKRIENLNFKQSNQTIDNLIKINDSFLIKAKISEFSFGFVWIYESHLIYYFKEDFDFDEFYNHFSKIEHSEKIFWNSAEFFDKAIKILEIFKKKSFIRIYRDEIINEQTSKIKNIKKKKINVNEKESYSFLKMYNSNRIKLIFYFYKN